MKKTDDIRDKLEGEETYEEWFIRQVQASIDDPRPSISDEESRKLMAEKRRGLFKKLKDQ